MLRSLQLVSAFWFSVIGLALFGAYLLVKNAIGGTVPYAVLQIADLPFALAALTYGGTSFLLSVSRGRVSRPLIGVTLAVLTVIFGALAWLNYLPLTEGIILSNPLVRP